MKNNNFFYQQYDKINWEKQEKTKINLFVNNFIIKEYLLKKKDSSISVFDIGFGIGFFFKLLYKSLGKRYKRIILEGCEPSSKNYHYYVKKPLRVRKTAIIKTFPETFLDTKTSTKFDFITCIYVFPHFVSNEIKKTAAKIHSMLSERGKFILVVANEKYLEEKLRAKKDLFIENNIIGLGGRKYKEILHYSDIPKIGKLIDYNREEAFYLHLFRSNGFELLEKKDLNDSGFICTVFVFEKK
ncbi:methyltransferase domain-containing protein [Candidatus Woesearchaeota archaeon]|nr:methyltransferase domain-containing protein [Candidatus Woesearchaeota archaeon]